MVIFIGTPFIKTPIIKGIGSNDYLFYGLELNRVVYEEKMSCFGKIKNLPLNKIGNGKNNSLITNFMDDFECLRTSMEYSESLWVNNIYKDLLKNIDSVDEDGVVLNNSFIAFMNFTSLSEINLIIDCINKHIPIIINKTETTIDLLGENYPLYYNSASYFKMNEQINSLLTIKILKKVIITLKKWIN